MRQSVRLRAAPTSAHPPYGLFVDPHSGSHTWWAIDARLLVGLTAVLTSLGALLSVAAH